MDIITKVAQRMIARSGGSLRDIEHLLKVWAYARLIARAEGLDEGARETLEIAALVHDIACPLCREKYGSAPGKLQEQEGPPLARALLDECGVNEARRERIAFLVGHHHTLEGVDGPDWRILLEADFLVNAGEKGLSPDAIRLARERVFATDAGRALLDDIYLGGASDGNVRIRPARGEDIPAVARIYDAIHSLEEQGRAEIGWDRAVYPTEATAREALLAGDLFVLELDGRVAGSARINRRQVPVYAEARWRYPAEEAQVMVLHTLVIDPACAGRGLGSRFVRFYERYARERGCDVLRMDTNARNAAARRLYARLGYREADIVPCRFNGIPDVDLVCLEKRLA